jgi:hypothetical protein
LPLHVGLKLFQSVQPEPAARLPSASSKPVWSAIEPFVPQPVEANDCNEKTELSAGKREEPKRLELELKCRRPSECREEREMRRACPWAREERWVELMVWLSERPQAVPIVSVNRTATPASTVTPRKLRRRSRRQIVPGVSIVS